MKLTVAGSSVMSTLAQKRSFSKPSVSMGRSLWDSQSNWTEQEVKRTLRKAKRVTYSLVILVSLDLCGYATCCLVFFVGNYIKKNIAVHCVML